MTASRLRNFPIVTPRVREPDRQHGKPRPPRATPCSDEPVQPRPDVEDDDFCYVATRGRVTGQPHEIEIWFAAGAAGSTLYLLSGGGDRSDWVRNLRAEPSVTVRLRDTTYDATARVLEPGTDEDALARRLVYEKYQPRYSGRLDDWREHSLPVAIDLQS